MITKLFEVRDRGTFIPVIAIKVSHDTPKEHYLLARSGYTEERNYVLLARLQGSTEMNYDPYEWGNRTMQQAHHHITEHFDELEPGAVIDVEFILGETSSPKRSEAEF